MAEAKTRDAEATRRAILEAAEKVFAEKGFAEATTSEIAARAEVTKSLIHHYFGSKEGLWSEVKSDRFGEYAGVQKSVLEQNEGTAELLRASMEMYFRFLGRNPDYVRLLGWLQLEPPPEEGFAPGEELTLLGVEKIREAQEKGLLRKDISPFSILMAFLGMCEHWFQGKAHHCQKLDPSFSDDEQFRKDAEKIFFEGVLPR